jgi:hypothetical protein
MPGANTAGAGIGALDRTGIGDSIAGAVGERQRRAGHPTGRSARLFPAQRAPQFVQLTAEFGEFRA